MSGLKLAVSVTYDPAKGYVASADGLPPVTALSLSMLRRRIEERLIGEDLEIRLMLDPSARLERDQRRRGGGPRSTDYARPR
jgi:hypothetical protein